MNARVFILDNVDSFTYNLAQAFMKLGAEVRVERAAIMEAPSPFGERVGVRGSEPTHLVLSPGPLRPSDHPMNFMLLDQYAGKIPILGVCLGMQAINEWCGGTLRGPKPHSGGEGGARPALPVGGATRAPVIDTPPMHGKTSEVRYAPGAPLLDGLPNPFTAARYHSLVVDRLGKGLRATAWTEQQGLGDRDLGLTPSPVVSPSPVVMALAHERFPLFGVQFHPESYLTPDGERMLQQFLRV